MNKEDLKIRLLENLSKSRSNDPHSDIGFYIHQTRSLLFAYTIFGEDVPVKSLRGNNGDFSKFYKGIYKSIVPITIGIESLNNK